ncbi:MAG: mechanosensitive ion channel [Gammaproteobacteria bacterium]|nr:mechanosensitive ion channel [Gammaproteobacteria bacterium]
MQEILTAIGEFLDWVVYTPADGTAITVGQLLLIGLLILAGFVLGGIVKRLISRRLTKMQLQKDAIHAIERITFYVILIVVVMTALQLLHIPLTAFAFISGAIAIGVGFGAQNILNNFISGWILMSERPVRIGDVVELGEDFGTVEAIGGRSTRIRRTDGVHLLVPNSTLLETTVVNWTLVDRNIRTSLVVGVAYGSPVRKVEELLMQAVKEQKEVLEEPEPQVIFDNFGDSSLDFEIYFWSNVGNEKGLRQIRSEIRFRITDLFDEHGITIPFPQRDVHLFDTKASKT